MLTIAEHIYLHFLLLTTIKDCVLWDISVWFLFDGVLIDGFLFKFDDIFVEKSINEQVKI